ncbi:Hypothetical protein DHA2_153417, partial [Giardia duodenalis]
VDAGGQLPCVVSGEKYGPLLMDCGALLQAVHHPGRGRVDAHPVQCVWLSDVWAPSICTVQHTWGNDSVCRGVGPGSSTAGTLRHQSGRPRSGTNGGRRRWASKLNPGLSDARTQSEYTLMERPRSAPGSGYITEEDSLVISSKANPRFWTGQEGAGPPARSLGHTQIAPAE